MSRTGIESAENRTCMQLSEQQFSFRTKTRCPSLPLHLCRKEACISSLDFSNTSCILITDCLSGRAQMQPGGRGNQHGFARVPVQGASSFLPLIQERSFQ